MHARRASTFCYGLCLALGVAGTGCVNDHEIDEGESSSSSAIIINANAAYTIVGVQSGKCVGVVDASTASNARLDIETCTGTASQRFRPEAMGGGFFRLRNERSGLCADVLGVSLNDGALVIQFACGTGQNQQWSFTDVGSAERLTARHSGKVLDVTAQGTGDGTLLEQWTSNNGTNQQFTVIEALPAFGPE
jgi:hypothetical protein